MKTIEAAIPPELMASLREAAGRMDRMREETYRKHGLLDIGVPAIRGLRDGVIDLATLR